MAIPTVAFKVIDRDQAGLVLTQTGHSTDVAEGGITDEYHVSLTRKPTSPVTVDFTGYINQLDLFITGTPLHTGTASVLAADPSMLEDSEAAFTTSLTDYYIRITGGTGAGQLRRIVSNTATTLTVAEAWTTAPGSTSTYEIAAQVTSLTFDETNWDKQGTITVTAKDDAAREGFRKEYITHTVSSADLTSVADGRDTFAASEEDRTSVLLTHDPLILAKGVSVAHPVGNNTLEVEEGSVDFTSLQYSDAGVVNGIVQITAGTGKGQSRRIMGSHRLRRSCLMGNGIPGSMT